VEHGADINKEIKKGETILFDVCESGNKELVELRKIKVDQTKYRSAIGNLLYLSICTCPDIIYPVSKAAQKSKDPNLEDWQNICNNIHFYY